MTAGNEISTKIQHAISLHQKGDLQTAILHYDEILQKDPNNPDVLKLLALAFDALGQKDQALQCMQQSLVLNCTQETLSQVGELYGNFQDFSRFLLDYLSLRVNQSVIFELHVQGDHLVEQGEYQGAEALFRRILEIDPNYLTQFNNYSKVLYKNNKTQEAKEAYLKSLQAKGEAFTRDVIEGPLMSVKQYCQQFPEHKYKCLKEQRSVTRTTVPFYGEAELEGFGPLEIIQNEPEFYIAELRNMNFMGGFNPLFDQQGHVLYDLSAHPRSDFYDLAMSDKFVRFYSKDRMFLDVPKEKIEIPTGILFSYLSIQCWGHWLYEYAPMFWCLDRSPEYDQVPLLVDERLYQDAHIMEMLKVLNHKKRPEIKISYMQRYQVANLIVLSRLVHLPHDKAQAKIADYEDCKDIFISDASMGYLRDKFYDSKREGTEKLKRLYVLRASNLSNYRFLENQDEVIALFKEFGFETVELSQFSYEDKANLLANTEAIAGPSGSWGINTMFFRPHTKRIIFSVQGHEHKIVLPNIAGVPNEDLLCVRCKPVPGSHAIKTHLNYVADLKMLRKLLEDTFPNS